MGTHTYPDPSWPELLRRRLAADDRSVYSIAAAAGIQRNDLARFARAEKTLTLEVAERLARALGLALVVERQWVPLSRPPRPPRPPRPARSQRAAARVASPAASAAASAAKKKSRISRARG